MRKVLPPCLIFVLFLFFSVAFAGEAAYTAVVPVKSQSEADRLLGFHVALSQVVNRISRNNLMANQLKVNQMSNVYPYIHRYYYQQGETEDDVDEEGNPISISTRSQNLMVEFDPLSVDNLIKTVNSSIVSTPSLNHVLVWLSVQQAGEKAKIISNDEEDKLAQQIKFMGKTKNIDVLLPMLDIEDISLITAKELNQFNISAISQASVRYGSDLVLVGSVVPDQKEWKVQWMLLKNGKRFMWSDQGVSVSGAILSGLLKASEMITTSTAAETNQEGHIVLTVEGINNVTDYASVNAYLQQLNEVSSIQVLRVGASRVVFDIILTNNNRDAFIKVLEANPRFTSESSLSSRELNYRWKVR